MGIMQKLLNFFHKKRLGKNKLLLGSGTGIFILSINTLNTKDRTFNIIGVSIDPIMIMTVNSY
ncbi:hypothetical protein ENUP19_0218G0008 [Entamoeba nuttalli]|uniref:Uncharacterized protein n=1 Tax=Entamoeba nuttalli TaxID=412467 RepID=A0ABQ0DPG7_9EUKA